MNNVIKLKIRKPNNKQDYLNICKLHLKEELYKDILCGIMDYQLYIKINPKLQKIVDCYYALP